MSNLIKKHAITHCYDWWEEEIKANALMPANHYQCPKCDARTFTYKKLFINHLGIFHEEFDQKLAAKDKCIDDFYDPTDESYLEPSLPPPTHASEQLSDLMDNKTSRKKVLIHQSNLLN